MNEFEKRPIDEQLEYFSDAFDFYMEVGSLPDDYPPGLAGGFMGNMLLQNPQLPDQDPLWQETLKDETLRFLSVLLGAFKQVDDACKPEEKMIGAFGRADLNGKRKMWKAVSDGISGKYSQAEIDLEAFNEQFTDHDPEDVLDSLTKEWDKAFEERKDKEKERILRQMEQRWRQHVDEAGTADFECRKKFRQEYLRYPALAEIVKMMGREQPQSNILKDEIVYKYLPTLVSPNSSTTEVEEVSAGNDVMHMLPSESAIMADPSTEIAFYHKFASKQLQILTSKPPLRSQKKAKSEKKLKPRLEKGPIIVSMDTSGSMEGRPERLAKCLLMQLISMAKKQKRKCYLITFSVRAHSIDLAAPGNWDKVKDFLEHGFTGGTDGEQMLKMIFDVLKSKAYEMADALIISDFYFPVPIPATMKKLEDEKGKGTRFYGLQIGKQKCSYQTILDQVWKV